ncbi:hypothetical protein [Caulifigura coniformis]|uniref:hypothetical protein n=1 Tax=Caulifigura coniformis TaxID=2527983 RepID=UPI0011A98E05|nr:hypothetical protein [Caulifigura coniformis]
MSPFDRWASGFLDTAKHVVEGTFLIVWVQDQEQAEQLLNGRGDCPRGTVFFISKDLPDGVLTDIQNKFPLALVSREPEPERAPESHVI